MKIINYVANEGSEDKTGVILRALERAVCDYAYLVPDGWRFILKMQVAGEREPYYWIDVQSNRGGGNYALAKMTTLELFPEKAATCDDGIGELVRMIARRDRDGAVLAEQIRELNDVDQMTDEMWEWLRDEVRIAPCYGGVRIPYEDMIVEGDEIATECGEIRVVFSGASQEQDLFFALVVFRALNDAFVRLYPNTQGWLNLREVGAIPAVKFWLDLLQIKEA